MRQLSNVELIDLLWTAFDKVNLESRQAAEHLKDLRKGKTESEWLDEVETLKTYRETLKQAVAKLDSVIDG